MNSQSGTAGPLTYEQLVKEANRQALTQGLLAAGFGVLSNPGSLGYAAGRGGLLGLGAYNQSRDEYLKNRLGAVQLTNALDALNQNTISRKVLQDFYGNNGQVASPSAIANQAPAPAQAAPTAAPPSPSGPFPLGANGLPQAPADWVVKTTADGIPYMGPPSGSGSSPTPAPSSAPASAPAGVPAKGSVYQMYKELGNRMAAAGAVVPAQQYYDMAEKYRPKLKETKTLTQNGQRVSVNIYDDGTTEVLPLGPDQEKAHFLDTGSQVGAVDPFTGKPIAGGGLYNKTMTPGETASNTLGYANLAETKRYHNLEMGMDESGNMTNVDNVAHAIATYQQAPLSAWAMAKPYGGAIMAKVMEINPQYDAKNYATAQQTQNAFAKGPQGNTVRSIGVAMQHLDVLQQAGDALNNDDMQAFNKVGNFFASQTGRPAPTNFNAVKDLVANEITKAITGTGGGVSDRDKAQKTVDAANSPQQLAAVIASYKQLFAGQLSGLEQQYKAGTQQGDFRTRFLTPETSALLDKGGGAAPGTRQVYIDKNGNRAYKNPDGSFTEIK